MYSKENEFPGVTVVALSETAGEGVLSSEGKQNLDQSRRDIAGSNVLIADEHYKHSLGIVRHLGRRGAHVSIVASSRNSLACRSRYCHQVILSRGANLESLVETALQSVKSNHYDLVMPISYPMTLALARKRDKLAPYTHLETVESEALEIAADKVKMTDLANSVGVPAPKTLMFDGLGESAGSLPFPVVVKPRNESPGHPLVRYARSAAELNKISSAKRMEKPGQGNYLVQEFIPGYGCGFFATYQQGICKRVFMHRRVREYPATGGASSCAESFYDAKLEMYGRRMLDALRWHGVAMVEFRRDSRDGEYKLMEINPKFWGSLDLALAAGADFPGDLCRMALGEALSFCGDYKRKLRFHWPFSTHGELFHLWTRPQSVFDAAVDFLNPRVKSNVWLSDFGPNIQEMSSIARKLFSKRKD